MFRSILLLAALTASSLCLAAEEGAGRAPAAADPEAEFSTAPVVIDGRELFRLRGVSSHPAEQRAARVVERIEEAARDPAVTGDSIGVVETEGYSAIMAGERRLMAVVDADARLEQVDRAILAQTHRDQIREAIETYRAARSPEKLVAAGLYSAGATAVLAAALALLVWLTRRLDVVLEQRFHRRIRSVGVQSFEILRAERIWGALRGVLVALRVLAILAAVFFYLTYVLGLFPWTRALSAQLLDLVIGPLQTIARAVISEVPNLIFLAVIFFIVRFAVRLMRLFFDAVARGTVTFSGFDAEWALPTYKIARFLLVVFGVIVAYPYIPGSDSAAFKGVSLFLGVVFSLGSSSAIANIIAGYMMTYRRAFKVGDRVKIGDTMGDVIEIRLQVSHLRTPKNEEVIVPNSQILNSEVVNYSSLAKAQGLILHTTVGIGYEVPWRQVESMLLMAAERTPGLLKEPAPFVFQKSLGDFAVNYELNVHCDNAQAMGNLYTELHRSILDVFNEYGVQIMTPAYEGDPEQPKVVPKAHWYAAPAAPEKPAGT